MSVRLLTFTALAPLALGGIVAPALAAHRQVFLLGGQSNMVGGGNPVLPISEPYADPLPDVQLYFGTSPNTTGPPAYEWRDLGPFSGGTTSSFGPELTFGHMLHQTDPHGDYALIKHARGGSNVSADWNPTVEDNVYADFRDTVAGALQDLTDAGDTYEIVGMLWTQGVRDGKDGSTAEAYQTNLERLIADVRLRYGSDLPFFISRLSINQTGAGIFLGGRGEPSGLAAIRLGQENVALNDPLAFMIDTDEFGIGDPSHYNTSGYIDVGKAFAESYFSNVAVPEPDTMGLATILLLTLAGRFRMRPIRQDANVGPTQQ